LDGEVNSKVYLNVQEVADSLFTRLVLPKSNTRLKPITVDSTQHDNFDAEAKMLAKIKYDIISILIPRVKKKYIMSFIQTYAFESGCSRTS
jgi:hypothetical protein